MTKGNFRKRRREVDIQKVELLPSDVFPSESVMHEYQGRRVSNILLEFAKPLIEKIDRDNAFQFKTMLYFAAVSWNFSYFKDGEERNSALEKFIMSNDHFTDMNKTKMSTIVNSFSLLKRRSFWQYDFLLVNFETIKGEKDSSVIATAIPYSMISNVEKLFRDLN